MQSHRETQIKRIVLMGTPEFPEKAFHEIRKHSSLSIVALFCQPDRRSGRGQKVTHPPCKCFALKNDIPVFQPENLKEEKIFNIYKNLKPDLTLVAAYGKILPERYLNFPSHGAINIHSSLLPKLRGAAPINRAIERGYKKTGITIMKLAKKLDSGDILFQKETDILPDETAGELHDRLSSMAGDLIIDVLEKIFKGDIMPLPQKESEATYAPIIKKGEGKIDFKMPGQQIYNRIRGFSPWPGSYCSFEGKSLKILRARLLRDAHSNDDFPCGTVIDIKKGHVRLSDSTLELLRIQLEGKRAVDWASFANGLKTKNRYPVLR